MQTPLTEQIERALEMSSDGVLRFDAPKLARLEARFHLEAREQAADAAARAVFEALLALQGAGHTHAVEQLVVVVTRVLEHARGPEAARAFVRFADGADISRRAPRLGATRPAGARSLRSLAPLGLRVRA